jgi:hypothetical protein
MRYAMPPLMSSCTTFTSHAPTAGVAVACFKRGQCSKTNHDVTIPYSVLHHHIHSTARAFTLGDSLLPPSPHINRQLLKANRWHGNLRVWRAQGAH